MYHTAFLLEILTCCGWSESSRDRIVEAEKMNRSINIDPHSGAWSHSGLEGYLETTPVVPEKYCKQSGGPAENSDPQANWVTYRKATDKPSTFFKRFFIRSSVNLSHLHRTVHDLWQISLTKDSDGVMEFPWYKSGTRFEPTTFQLCISVPLAFECVHALDLFLSKI